jgi:tetratricopeptide (TPR) repeat protein
MKLSAVILVLLAFVAPGSGCGPDKSVKYYNLGLEAAKRDDYAEAVKLWNEAVRYRPDDPETRYNLGAALIAMKRYAEAETHLREAVALNSLDADAYQLLGKSLEEQEKLPEAKNAYGFALGIKPTQVPSLVGLASIALKEGQNRSAENHATQAVALDPGNLEANMLLSEAYFRNGDFNAAYGQILSARKLGPANAALFFLTGKIAYSRRMYADALDALRSASATSASRISRSATPPRRRKISGSPSTRTDRTRKHGKGSPKPISAKSAGAKRARPSNKPFGSILPIPRPFSTGPPCAWARAT